jgi:hypothetical protein
VLRVISSSPADLQLFEATLDNAVRICDALVGGICRWDGHALHQLLQNRKSLPSPNFSGVRRSIPTRSRGVEGPAATKWNRNRRLASANIDCREVHTGRRSRVGVACL